MSWHANMGHAPVFYPDQPDQPCPPHLLAESEASGARVRVRLRNGREPDESWPIAGRPIPTRWTLIGSDFDIIAWRRA
jgi:hypothetical protein